MKIFIHSFITVFFRTPPLLSNLDKRQRETFLVSEAVQFVLCKEGERDCTSVHWRKVYQAFVHSLKMKIKLLFHFTKFIPANSSSINVNFQEAKKLCCFPFQGYNMFFSSLGLLDISNRSLKFV